jgi:peptide/nickel transport system permease protein
MAAYTLKKLLWLVITLWLAVTLLFFLFTLGPPTPIIMLAEGTIDPEQYELLRHRLGLDQPIYQQYADWIWNSLHGDLGNSYWTGAPVTEELAKRLPYTIGLMIITAFFTLILTIPMGVISVFKRGTFIESGVKGFQLIFMSAPVFWIGILILGWLATAFHWHPRVQYATLFSDPLTALRQYLLPAFLMGLAAAAIGSRMLRSSMLSVMESEYIRTAPKGLRKWAVTYALPEVSIFGAQVSMLLGATVIMESLFNIPGLGNLLISSANAVDTPLLTGIILYFGITVLGFNFLVDIISGLIDQRIRSGIAQANLVTQITDY